MGWLNSGAEKRSAAADVDDMPSTRVVTPDTATYLAPVFSSIRAIVDYVSTLPLDFYRREPDGTRSAIAMPELFRNIDDEYGIENWIGQGIYATVTRGNAVGRITATSGYNGARVLPTMIEWAKDWSAIDDREQIPWWHLDGRPASPSTVAHIPWLVPHGRRLGLSPIQHFATLVAAGLSAQEYADVKRGGGIPPSILKNVMQVLDPKAAEKVRDRAGASFASGKPFVTGKDWDLSIVSIPPAQAQFIETLKLSATQIAAIYGIDPREVGGGASDSLTYTNDESRARNRAHNMRPYIVRFEQAIARWLPGGQAVRLDVGETIRADIKTQTEIVGSKLKDGRLSLNEALALEGRPPVAGGDYRNIPRSPSEPVNREGVDA